MPRNKTKCIRSNKKKRKTDVYSDVGKKVAVRFVNETKHPDYEEFKKILEKIETQNKSK